jgi:predicted Zn-dependent protease
LSILSNAVILSEAKNLSLPVKTFAGSGQIPSQTMSTDRIAKALELWKKFPDNDLSRFNLAQAYLDANDHAHALDHLRALCERKPDWMVVHIQLGKSLIALGRPAEARPILEHGLKLAIAQHHDGPREELTALLKTL